MKMFKRCIECGRIYKDDTEYLFRDKCPLCKLYPSWKKENENDGKGNEN